MADDQIDVRARITADSQPADNVLRDFADKIKRMNMMVGQTVNSGLTQPIQKSAEAMRDAARDAEQHVGQTMTGAFTKAAASVNAFVGGLTGVGLALGAAGIGRAIRDAVEAFGNVEEGQIRIRQAMGATQEQVEALTEMMHDLSAKTGMDIKELQATFLDFGARSGKSIEEVTALFPLMVVQAHDTKTELATVSRLVADSVGAMKLPMEEVPKLFDAWTTSLTGIEGEFARFFTRVTPDLVEFGRVTEKDQAQIAAMFKVLTQGFGGGQRGAMRAGQALSGVLQEAYSTQSPLGMMVRPQIEATRARGGGPAEEMQVVAQFLQRQGAFQRTPGGLFTMQAEAMQKTFGVSDKNTIAALELLVKGQKDITAETEKQAANIGVTLQRSKELSSDTLGFFHRLADAWDRFMEGAGGTLAGHPPTMSQTPAQKRLQVPWLHSLGIPGFAEGGIVTEPTLAMVAERGPEKITPLTGHEDRQTEENTSATRDNTAAVNRLSSYMLRPERLRPFGYGAAFTPGAGEAAQPASAMLTPTTASGYGGGQGSYGARGTDDYNASVARQYEQHGYAAPGATPPMGRAGPPAAPGGAPRGGVPSPRGDIPSGTGTYGEAVTGGKRQVAQIMADEFRKAGMSENSIAGVMANVTDESNFNPTLRHPDQPHFSGEAHFAHGLFQEGGTEWNNYDAWLKKNYPGADWRDPRLQSRFLAQNLKQRYPGVWSQMQRGSREQAAGAFVRGYLKPAAGPMASRTARYSRGVPSVEHYTGPAGAGAGPVTDTAPPLQHFNTEDIQSALHQHRVMREEMERPIRTRMSFDSPAPPPTLAYRRGIARRQQRYQAEDALATARFGSTDIGLA